MGNIMRDFGLFVPVTGMARKLLRKSLGVLFLPKKKLHQEALRRTRSRVPQPPGKHDIPGDCTIRMCGYNAKLMQVFLLQTNKRRDNLH